MIPTINSEKIQKEYHFVIILLLSEFIEGK